MSYKKIIFIAVLLKLCLIASLYGSVRVSWQKSGPNPSGPWTYEYQKTDTIINSEITASVERIKNGNGWTNLNQKQFTYSGGLVTESIYSTWNDAQFVPQKKEFLAYYPSGKISGATLFHFQNGEWTTVSKKEYTISNGLETLITEFIYANGDFVAIAKVNKSFNGSQLTTETRTELTGSEWTNIYRKNYQYDQANRLEQYYMEEWHEPFWYPVEGVFYLYNSQGYISDTYTTSLTSFLYEDADTAYIETEVDYEYHETFSYDASGNLIYKNGQNIGGVSSNGSFSNFSYSYDSNGEMSGYTAHSGSNTFDNYTVVNIFNYELLNVVATPSPGVCSGCNDGSITIEPSGGVPPYSINWIPLNSGIMNAMEIENLSADTYHITVTDSIGNSVTQEVTVNGMITAISSQDREVEFFVYTDRNRIVIHNTLSGTSGIISDLSGKTVATIQPDLGIHAYSPDLPSGIYMYSFVSGYKAFTGKLLLIH